MEIKTLSFRVFFLIFHTACSFLLLELGYCPFQLALRRPTAILTSQKHTSLSQPKNFYKNKQYIYFVSKFWTKGPVTTMYDMLVYRFHPDGKLAASVRLYQ